MSVTVRPVYSSRLRSLSGYVFGVYAGNVLTAIYAKYPSKLMREIQA